MRYRCQKAISMKLRLQEIWISTENSALLVFVDEFFFPKHLIPKPMTFPFPQLSNMVKYDNFSAVFEWHYLIASLRFGGHQKTTERSAFSRFLNKDVWCHRCQVDTLWRMHNEPPNRCVTVYTTEKLSTDPSRKGSGFHICVCLNYAYHAYRFSRQLA